MRKLITPVVLTVALGMLLPVISFAGGEHDGHHKDEPAAATNTAFMATAGEVKKVDKESGKVTLKHGPIKNLDMPGMTMLFRVKAPAMLEQLKEGDKIKFMADKINGAFTITQFEPAN